MTTHFYCWWVYRFQVRSVGCSQVPRRRWQVSTMPSQSWKWLRPVCRSSSTISTRVNSHNLAQSPCNKLFQHAYKNILAENILVLFLCTAAFSDLSRGLGSDSMFNKSWFHETVSAHLLPCPEVFLAGCFGVWCLPRSRLGWAKMHAFIRVRN